jgi:rhodanese-related sulfurtransferase
MTAKTELTAKAELTTSISREKLRSAIDEKTAVVVDALPAAPYRRRHLPGALNLVVEDADAKAAEVLPDKDATIVTYSTDVECGRGERLAERLRELGYADVRTYHEGIEDWVGNGLAVQTGG